MQIFVFTLLSFLFVGSSVFARPLPLVMIHKDQGWYHQKEKEIGKKIGNWLAVTWQNHQLFIKPAIIASSKAHPNECMGGIDINLNLKPESNALFLVPAKALTTAETTAPKLVPTWFSGTLQLHPGDSIEVGGPGISCTSKETNCVKVSAVGKRIKKKNETEFKGYEIVVFLQGRRHIVFRQPDYFAKPVSLLWVGDLNGDGRPDMILDQNSLIGSEGRSLYLSTPRNDKPLILTAEQNPEPC